MAAVVGTASLLPPRTRRSGVPRVGAAIAAVSEWVTVGRGSHQTRAGVVILIGGAPRGHFWELLPDLEAGAGLGGKLVMAVELRLWELLVEGEQERDDGGTLLRGHRVGWDKLCRE